MATSVNFLRHVPSSFNPLLSTTQWAETLPNYTLPSGKVWITSQGDYTYNDVVNKGVSHWSIYDLHRFSTELQNQLINSGKTYNAVPRTEHMLHLPFNGSIPETWAEDQYGVGYSLRYWPNGPFNQSQSITAANNIGTAHAILIGENEERESWIDPRHPMWGWIWTRYRQLMDEKWGSQGIPYFFAHNYFHFLLFGWANLGATTRADHKAKFARPVANWEPNNYTPGGSLSKTNLICEAVYINAPDSAPKGVLGMMFNCKVNRKMGYSTCVFLQKTHEWRPNNYVSTNYPQSKFPTNWGTLFKHDGIVMDPNDLMSYIFWGLEEGDFVHEWAAGAKANTDNLPAKYARDDKWFPQGATSDTGQSVYSTPEGTVRVANSFPHYNDSVYKSNTPSNYATFGVRMYADTMGKCTGVGSTEGYCQYRLNGGSWITPSQQAHEEIVDCFFDNRAMVKFRRKDGKIALAYFNQVGSNLKQTIEIKHPTMSGVSYTATVCGNATHAVLINEETGMGI